MNKIYRVIWNASLGVWVAVSELAKGKTKSRMVSGQVRLDDESPKSSRLFKITFLTLCIGASSPVFATKIITTTGIGAGTATTGSIANDGSMNIFDWQNPFLPLFMQLGTTGTQAAGGAVAIGDNAQAIARSSVVIGSNSTATINGATTVAGVDSTNGVSVVIGANNYSNGNKPNSVRPFFRCS